jgi:hypothetical protein
MLVEILLFLIAVKRIHDKLTGTHDTIELSLWSDIILASPPTSERPLW